MVCFSVCAHASLLPVQGGVNVKCRMVCSVPKHACAFPYACYTCVQPVMYILSMCVCREFILFTLFMQTTCVFYYLTNYHLLWLVLKRKLACLRVDVELWIFHSNNSCLSPWWPTAHVCPGTSISQPVNVNSMCPMYFVCFICAHQLFK
jgi:hypothetical protein